MSQKIAHAGRSTNDEFWILENFLPKK